MKLQNAVADTVSYVSDGPAEGTVKIVGCARNITLRWVEQLRTVRHRLQRWLPAVGGLPLWSFHAGDVIDTIDSLQRDLNDLSGSIIKLADPLSPLSASAVDEMEQKLSVVSTKAQRLEQTLVAAAAA